MVRKADTEVKDLVEQALELQDLLNAEGWQFCFIGGIAVQRWGEPRFTKDMDLTILTGYGPEEEVARFLVSHYQARVPDPIELALYNRIVLLQTSHGIGIDISLGALPFEEAAVERAKLQKVIPKVSLKLCTAEDLIVFKAFADRGIDWNDIRGILVRQNTKKLDWTYIHRHLDVLAELKEEPRIVTQLQELRESIAATEP